MSVAMNCNSGEFGEDSVNLMQTEERSKYGWRSQLSVLMCGSVWWIGVAAVCLGILLLFLILGVVAHNSNAIGSRDTKCENLINGLTSDREALRDEHVQLKVNSSLLTKEMKDLQSQCNALRDERDRLKINSSNLAKEKLVLQTQYNDLRDERQQLRDDNRNLTVRVEILQSQYRAMTASRDKLQEEVNRLNLNKTKSCHEGWKTFQDKCYYLSPSGLTKTWDSARKDCKERGADLVIITTIEELNFVSQTYGVTWIGLSDKVKENKWVWVDGTELAGDDFWQDGEPNNSDGNEDCAEVSRSAKRFNDVPCTRKFSWACEN